MERVFENQGGGVGRHHRMDPRILFQQKFRQQGGGGSGLAFLSTLDKKDDWACCTFLLKVIGNMYNPSEWQVTDPS